MNTSPHLRADAETLGQSLPALLAEAAHLAASLTLGSHGRRRAGQGDAFWQFRAAQTGDSASNIDWRRSARSDGQFVREREWQAVQTVAFWVDQSLSMTFSGTPDRAPKLDRARVLTLALAILLLRGGERVGLIGGAPARHGRAQIGQILAELGQTGTDYGAAAMDGAAATGRAVYISDFLGPLDTLQQAITQTAERGIRGCLIQILDPVEEDFPFHGHVIFQSMAGSVQHETHSAADLRVRYLERLAARKDALATLCRNMGWLYMLHHSDQPATQALLWAYSALKGGR